MTFLRLLLRFLNGIRDRVSRVLTGVVEPPLSALARLLRTVRDRIDAAIERLLEWWSNIFRAGPRLPGEETNPPSKAGPLIAAAVLGLSLYTWPVQEYIPGKRFVWLAFGIWLVTLVITRASSRVDSTNRAKRWLREAEKRAGLLWWERAGAVIALIILWFGVHGRPRLLLLAAALLLGFLRLLITDYQLRELGVVRRHRRLPEPSPSPPGTVTRSFAWNLSLVSGTTHHTLAVPIEVSSYEAQKAANPGRRWEGERPCFEDWVVPPSSDVDRTSILLAEISRKESHSTFGEVSNVLAFVQSVPYSLDADSVGQEDYWRFPVETLYDVTGDCEDTSILAAAVLRTLGHRVAMALLPEHAAIGVEVPEGTPGEFALVEGRRMYFCETTAGGWNVGQVPDDLRGVHVRWFPIL